MRIFNEVTDEAKFKKHKISPKVISLYIEKHEKKCTDKMGNTKLWTL